MEGYLHLRMAPWLRRLITRLLALVPAVVVICAGGRAVRRSGCLILSQVILSLQLSFAVIPLIHFTSNRRNMGEFATPWWGQVLAWTAAAIIVALNGKLVLDQIGEWVDALATEHGARRADPVELAGGGGVSTAWRAAAVAAACLGDGQAVRPSVAGLAAAAEREARLGADAAAPAAVADRRGARARPGDAEILNRALGLAQTQAEPCELVLLHVVDTAMTRVLGPETADRETDADERYLADAGRRPARAGLSGPVGPAPRPEPGRRAGRPPPARPGRPAGRRLARPRHGPRPAPGPDRRPRPAPPRGADADRPAGSSECGGGRAVGGGERGLDQNGKRARGSLVWPCAIQIAGSIIRTSQAPSPRCRSATWSRQWMKMGRGQEHEGDGRHNRHWAGCTADRSSAEAPPEPLAERLPRLLAPGRTQTASRAR